MKKLLSVVTLLGALAGAASAAPYVLPAPAGGALTPYDWQPVYSIEGLYSVADDSDDPDMAGVRGTLSLYSSAESSVRHQFNVNIGILAGDKKYDGGGKMDFQMVPVTLGYNINLGITDNVFVYLGAKAGCAWAEIEDTDADGKWKDSGEGFTFSVGGGVKVQCSDSIYLHAGYEFGRTFIEIDDDESKHAIYGAHTFLIGVGCKF